MANLDLIDSLDLIKIAREVGHYLNRSLREALAEVPIAGDAHGERNAGGH
ncbi:hypothetical protein [Paraburkholderia aromaticivorans]|nr:hypothetical protein [Paraburkholderia aromaticivorans]